MACAYKRANWVISSSDMSHWLIQILHIACEDVFNGNNHISVHQVMHFTLPSIQLTPPGIHFTLPSMHVTPPNAIKSCCGLRGILDFSPGTPFNGDGFKYLHKKRSFTSEMWHKKEKKTLVIHFGAQRQCMWPPPPPSFPLNSGLELE